MKKIIATLLIGTMLTMTACGSAAETTNNETTATESIETTETTATNTSENTNEDSHQVDKNSIDYSTFNSNTESTEKSTETVITETVTETTAEITPETTAAVATTETVTETEYASSKTLYKDFNFKNVTDYLEHEKDIVDFLGITDYEYTTGTENVNSYTYVSDIYIQGNKGTEFRLLEEDGYFLHDGMIEDDADIYYLSDDGDAVIQHSPTIGNNFLWITCNNGKVEVSYWDDDLSFDDFVAVCEELSGMTFTKQ